MYRSELKCLLSVLYFPLKTSGEILSYAKVTGCMFVCSFRSRNHLRKVSAIFREVFLVKVRFNQ